MYPISIIAVLLLIFGGLTLANYEREIKDANAARVGITSGQMRVYGTYVADYARSHPTFVGSVSDSAANLPTWLARDPSMSNRVTSGITVIFYRTTSIAEGYAFARECKKGLTCGVVRGGRIYVPGVTAPISTTASGIPDGSTALVLL